MSDTPKLSSTRLPKGLMSKITQYENAVEVAAHAGAFPKEDRQHIIQTAVRKRFLLEQAIVKLLAEKDHEIQQASLKY